MATETASSRPRRLLARWPFAGVHPAELFASTAHLLVNLAVGVVSFTVVVTATALTLGLLIVYPVGVASLTAGLAATRWLAAADRWRVGAFLRYRVEAPAPPRAPGTWHARLWREAAAPTTWRAIAMHVLRLPWGIVSFTAAVVVWTVPVALGVASVQLVVGGAEIVGPGAVVAAAAVVLLALLALPVIPTTVRVLADFDAALTAALLGPSRSEQVDARVAELSSSRERMVDATEVERRRIERDLHDGAGQQLVSLAMTLGMARQKMADDPEAAAALLDEAHAEAKNALAGLRDIVRGISPAILTDRGLGPALSSVAARSSVPVSLDVDVDERPDPATEGIAYYLVCEAISNAVRHSGASRVRVRLARAGDVLEVEVTDDGHGGADPTRGTGLRGLADRVDAVDGGLEVTSPPGGPTVVRAHLPVRAQRERVQRERA